MSNRSRRLAVAISFGALVATICSFTATPMQGAPINWTLTDFNTSTLDLSGTIVQAVNLGPSSMDVTIGADTVTFVAGNAGLPNGPSGVLDPLPEYTNSMGNAELTNVLATHGWQAGGVGTTATVSLAGLFPGVEYEIQAFMADVRDCCLTRGNRYSDGQGNETPLWTRGDGAIGIGTFTADSSSQDFFIIADSADGSSDPGISGYVLRAISGGTVDAVLNRDTGDLTITNNTPTPLNLLSYSVLSASGSLSQQSWTTIAGNTDASGTGDIDVDNVWTVLSNPESHGDLSEAELEIPAGDGGFLPAGQTLELGAVWIKSPTEDVQVELLLGAGAIPQLNTVFEGNGGQPFAVGDLDFNGAISADDWEIYIAGAQADLTGLSQAEAYQMGDLNNDGASDLADMDQFIELFDAANGVGSFAQLTANVPEPATLGLVLLGFAIAGLRRFRVRAISLQATAWAVALLLTTTSSMAAPVIWGEAFPVITDDDILITGEVIAALNVGAVDGDADIDVTLSGQVVTFTPAPLFGGTNTGAGGIPEVQSTGNAELDAVFDSHSWQGGNPIAAPVAFTFDSLDVGQTYQIQILGAVDARGCCLDRASIYQDTEDGSGNNSPNVHRSVDVGGLRYAHSVIGMFTADGPEQTFWLNSAPAPDDGTDPGSSAMILQTATGGPSTLSAEVNTVSGQITLANRTEDLVFQFNGYELTSEGGSLNVAGWNSFSDQNIDPVGGGDESGETWDEAGGASNSALQEGFLLGTTSLGPGDTLSLGAAYNTAVDAQDLLFRFRTSLGSLRGGTVQYDDTAPTGIADFNSDGVVDGADELILQRNFGIGSTLAEGDADGDGDVDGDDQSVWDIQFGGPPPAIAASAAVPEPSAIGLSMFALIGLLGMRRVRRGVAGVCGACLACVLVISVSQAASTNDRLYLMGDDSEESASVGGLVSTTFDSAGELNTGNLQDLTAFFGGTYADVSGRPMAGDSQFGIEFDGAASQGFMEGPRLGLPSTSAAAIPNGPEDYTGISNRGFQLWVQPASAAGPQSIVMDTNQHGLRISEEGNWSMRYNGADFDTDVAVDPGAWVHAMVVRPFGDSGPSSGSRLYINGVAVAAAAGGYNGADEATLVVGANTSEDFTVVGTEEFFEGVVDDLALFVLGSNASQDFGTFNLGEDNSFVAATLTGVSGDVNQDGALNDADVNDLVTGWRSENLLNGLRTGDINTLSNGDLNFDGVTDLKDVFALHSALLAATGAGFDFSLLNGVAVPEPSSFALSGILLGIIGWRRIGRHRAKSQ